MFHTEYYGIGWSTHKWISLWLGGHTCTWTIVKWLSVACVIVSRCLCNRRVDNVDRWWVGGGG